ncbi:hypothetical protein GCM10020000_21090 [Streptomyces olivoverticillatus]
MSAISLNERARRRSSGGPLSAATREFSSAGGDPVGGGVQGPYGPQHPAGEPEGGREGDQHGGGLARGQQQPVVQDPRAQLPGGRVGDDDRDDITVTDDG